MSTPSDFQYDVFLSHTSKDKDTVRDIANRLKSDGVRVWFAEWEINCDSPLALEEIVQLSSCWFRRVLSILLKSVQPQQVLGENEQSGLAAAATDASPVESL